MFDAAQSSIGNLGTFGEFQYDADIPAPAERNDHQLTGKRRDIACAVVEQRFEWNVESNPCDGHSKIRDAQNQAEVYRRPLAYYVR